MVTGKDQSPQCGANASLSRSAPQILLATAKVHGKRVDVVDAEFRWCTFGQ